MQSCWGRLSFQLTDDLIKQTKVAPVIHMHTERRHVSKETKMLYKSRDIK